jgi:hypothetical protein
LSYTDPFGLQKKKPGVKKPKVPSGSEARDALEEAAEMSGANLSLYNKICLEAECVDNCGNKYRITNWIPTRPTVRELEPNCTCLRSIWPRTPTFWDNPWYFQ